MCMDLKEPCVAPMGISHWILGELRFYCTDQDVKEMLR